MVRVSDLRLLYEYYYDTTWRILDQTEKLSEEQYTGPPPFGDQSLRDLLVHTLSAERGWRTGWQTGERISGLNVDEFPDVATLRRRWEAERDEMFGFLDSLSDDELEREFVGLPLWQPILHVANHGTQHRAEAAMILTHFGHSPGDVDLVFFLFGRKQAGS